MEATYPNLQTFEKKLYHYENMEELHYILLNIMLLIIHNGWFYCFCNKYQGCELNYNCGQRLCPFCRIPDYLTNFEEELDCAQFNLFQPKMFGFKLFPMLFPIRLSTTNGPWKLSVDISIIRLETVTLVKKMKLL